MFELRMPDVNNVLIAGNLTRDPAFRKTTNGTSVTNFWIASNRRFKDNNGQWRENVCYVGVVAWYKLAENCAENLRKGSAVIVEGELQSRSLRTEEGRNRNIVEIKARRIQFLNKKNEGDEENTARDTELNDKSPAESDEEEIITTAESEKKIEKEQEDNPRKGDFDFGFESLDPS
jgi:single-strand DNA-binding protein